MRDVPTASQDGLCSAEVPPTRLAPKAPAPAAVSDGCCSVARALAALAEIPVSRVTSGSRPGSAASSAPVGRVDLAGLTSVPPLHRPTVTGGSAVRGGGNHVGGGMRPPPPHTVALSDGTRISFRAVEEIPMLESA
jgi:hypothetical protein